MSTRIRQAIQHPVLLLQRHIEAYRERRQFATPEGYRARDYWQARYARFGFDLRGAGDRDLSEAENLRNLQADADLLLDLCRKHEISLSTARVLDAGCGNGFYAGTLQTAGVRRYTGVDIASTLLDGLRERYPEFLFRAADIGERLIEGEFDIILLLEVAQHIIDEQRFSFALRNLKLALAPDGILIISSPLGPCRRHSFYAVVRPLEAFAHHFPGWSLDGPFSCAHRSMFVLRRINGR